MRRYNRGALTTAPEMARQTGGGALPPRRAEGAFRLRRPTYSPQRPPYSPRKRDDEAPGVRGGEAAPRLWRLRAEWIPAYAGMTMHRGMTVMRAREWRQEGGQGDHEIGGVVVQWLAP